MAERITGGRRGAEGDGGAAVIKRTGGTGGCAAVAVGAEIKRIQRQSAAGIARADLYRCRCPIGGCAEGAAEADGAGSGNCALLHRHSGSGPAAALAQFNDFTKSAPGSIAAVAAGHSAENHRPILRGGDVEGIAVGVAAAAAGAAETVGITGNDRAYRIALRYPGIAGDGDNRIVRRRVQGGDDRAVPGGIALGHPNFHGCVVAPGTLRSQQLPG